MKTILLAANFMLGISCAQAQWCDKLPEGESFKFTGRFLTNEPYSLSRPVTIRLAFTNPTSCRLPLAHRYSGDQDPLYHLEIVNTDTGEEVERTAFGERIALQWDPNPRKAKPFDFMGGSIHNVQCVEPHMTVTHYLNLSVQFEFKKPGPYEVKLLQGFDPVDFPSVKFRVDP